MLSKACDQCGAAFSVPNWRGSAQFCSRQCADMGKVRPPNTVCGTCTNPLRVKPGLLTSRAIGSFCSRGCAAVAKGAAFSGADNPNYKGKNVDSDGYRIFPPNAKKLFGVDATKLHQAIACLCVGIARIPAGFHVHHRDCNVLNNAPENLAILSVSDHKWLHKQYGVAPLWAVTHGHVSVETLVAWSDDMRKAETLLAMTVASAQAQQAYIARARGIQ